MNEHGPAIFRAEAVRRHAESRDRTVLPRFVSPPVFLALWLSLALTATAGVAAWFARVPVYAAGPVVAVEEQGESFEVEVAGMALLPARHKESLHPGRTILVDLAGAGAWVPRPILAVEPDALSPAAARAASSLGPATASAITEPVVAVRLALEPLPSGLPASAYAGSVYRSQVQIGSRRLLALVPLVGPLLGG